MSFVDDLIAKINDVERRLSKQERLDRRAALAASAVYSGTPTANAIAYWTGAGTVAGDRSVYVNSGGSVSIGTSSPTQFVHVKRDQNATTLVMVENASGSASAEVGFRAVNNASKNASFQVAGSAYSPAYGAYAANNALLYGNTDFVLMADTAAGVIKFATGGHVEKARLDEAGILWVGVSSGGASILGIEAGTSGNDAAVGGVLYASVAAVGNVGGGEDDLMTYTVPANTLSANDMELRFEAWGTFVNNANAKTLKVLFGSDSFTVLSSGGGAPYTWYVTGRIVRTGAATQDVFIKKDDTQGTTPGLTISTATRTLSGSNVLKLTGTGTSNNDIVQEYFRVFFEDANT